jgi:hypothetical protein
LIEYFFKEWVYNSMSSSRTATAFSIGHAHMNLQVTAYLKPPRPGVDSLPGYLQAFGYLLSAFSTVKP